jgi:hypothetical protein
MRRQINYANLEITIVEDKKSTKANPNNLKTQKVILKEQVVIGDTPLEVMAFSSALKKRIENEYDHPIIIFVNRMEIIKSLGLTNTYYEGKRKRCL